MPQLYELGIQTTTGQLGLGLSLNSEIVRYQTWQLDRDLLNSLHQHLGDFLFPQTWTDLGYIAIAKGPGSFTSTRIGMVTARTLGQQLNLPVIPISSMASYVWSQRHHDDINSYIPVQMKATREQIYGAVYQLNQDKSALTCLLEDKVMSPEEWLTQLNTFKIEEPILITPDNLGDTVVSLLELAYLEWQKGKGFHWSEALPFYGDFPS